MIVLPQLLTLLALLGSFCGVSKGSEVVENICNTESVNSEVISSTLMKQEESIKTIKNDLDICSETDFKFGKSNAESLKNQVNGFKRTLGALANLIHHIESDLSIVSPAFEWAESPENVYIGVKFAHKLDTPPCIDIVKEKIDIQANTASLSAECRGKKKEYSLKFDLNKPISPSNSSWVLGSVGRGVFSLQKAESGKWGKLVKGESPRNMHVWWELKDKYKLEWQDFEKKDKTQPNVTATVTKVEEKEEEESEEVKNKRKDRKKAKKLAKTERNKLKKEKKKTLSNLEKLKSKKIEEIEEEFKQKKKEAAKEIDSKIEELQKELEKTLESIEKGSKTETEGFFSKITSFFSSTKKQEEL